MKTLLVSQFDISGIVINKSQNENIYFAGQITGVEGYVESISSGLVASLNAVKKYQSIRQNNEFEKIIFSEYTMIGALSQYISTANEKFQPMNANFGILPPLKEIIKDKKLKYQKLSERALLYIMAHKE